jgi:hypothetical protein
MTKKIQQLLMANAVLILAITATWWWNNQDRHTAAADEAMAFALADTVGIDQLVIGQNRILRQGNRWLLNNRYDADAKMLRQFFQLLPRIEVKKWLSQSPQIPSNALEVKCLSGNTEKLGFKFWSDKDETYALLPDGRAASLYVPGYDIILYEIFSFTEGEWRNKTILSTGWSSVQALSVDYPTQTDQSFRLHFDSVFYRVDDVSKLDTALLYNYLEAFREVRVYAYVNRPSLTDSLKTQAPFCVLLVQSVDDAQSNTIRLFPAADPRQMYGLLEKTQEAVLLDARYFTKFLLRKKDFQK